MSATEQAGITEDPGRELWLGSTPDGLSVAGELSYNTFGMLDARLRQLDDVGREALVLDVSGVTFCDSAGLSTFISAYRRARRRDTTITLLGVHGSLARVLAVTGIGSLFAVQQATRSESG